MKLLLIFAAFLLVKADEVEKPESNILKINDVCLEKEILSDSLSAYPMTVEYSSNTLYFSHGKSEETPKAGKLKIDTKEYEEIDGVGSGFAQTIDRKTRTVYFGGDQGIFKYDPDTKKAEKFGEKLEESNVWSLFFKDTLYYTVFPSQKVYYFVDGKPTIFEDMEGIKADTFIIDNEEEYFYTNETGLYSQKKGTKDAFLYKSLEGTASKGLIADLNGDVHVMLLDGIYGVNKETKTLQKILDIEDSAGNGIAFDNNNNMIYGVGETIYRLKEVKGLTC